MIYLIILLTFYSSKIIPGYIHMDYPTAKRMTQLSIAFKLSTPITSKDLLKISLPFPLHSSLTAAFGTQEPLSSPSLLTANYKKVYNPDDNKTDTPKQTLLYTQTIDSSIYFVKFLGENLYPIGITTDFFQITFYIHNKNALSPQKPGQILQVQLFTVAGVESTARIYDSNEAFGYFEMNSMPSQNVGVNFQILSSDISNSKKPEQAYNSYIDIDITSIQDYQKQHQLRIQVIFTNSQFSWGQTCSNQQKTTQPTISALPPALYCISNTNKVVINLPKDVLNQSKVRFLLIINNPSSVQTTGIEVLVLKQISSVVLGYGKVDNALTVNAIDIVSHQISLGWGLKPDSLLPIQAKVVRGDAANPTQTPYNTLKVTFQLGQSTPASKQYRVNLGLNIEIGAVLLKGYITTNLPSASNKVLTCKQQYADSPSKRRIGCTGVGQIQASTPYWIQWKMFFPYDVYQLSISCLSFGSITIYVMQTINYKENAFVLGRMNDFYEYLVSKPDKYYMIGRNESYLKYMQSYDLNLIVRSRDFQTYLETPQEVYVTNRLSTYPNNQNGFQDVFVVSKGLTFLTYLNTFNDVFIAALARANTDIVNNQKSTPIVSKSIPKNTLTLETVNSAVWTSSYSDTLVSWDDLTFTTTSMQKGLKVGSGKLHFNFEPISKFTKQTSGQIQNKFGLVILFPPTITLDCNSSSIIQKSPNNGNINVDCDSITGSQKYNEYTSVILSSKNVDGVDDLSGVFALEVTVGESNREWDFYVGAIDGINGPQQGANAKVINGYYLINVQLKSIPSLGPAFSLVNWFNDGTASLDGSEVPTMIRVNGQISPAYQNNVAKVAIYMSQVGGMFYKNYHKNQIFCTADDQLTTDSCLFQEGAINPIQATHFHQLSRIITTISSSSALINLVIPIIAPKNTQQITLYLALLDSSNKHLFVSNGILSPSTYSSNPTVNTASFGPDCSGCKLGQIEENLIMNAKYSQNSNDVNNIGGGFMLSSEWDYIGSSSIDWSHGNCLKGIKYLFFSTTKISYIHSIFCDLATSSSDSSSTLTIHKSNIPSKYGVKLFAYAAYSSKLGVLTAKAPFSQLATPQTTTIVLPTIVVGLKKGFGVWQVTLPVKGDHDMLINIQSGSFPFSYSSGHCAVYLKGSPNKQMKQVICNPDFSTTLIKYTLRIKEPLFQKGDTLLIVHYGIDQSSMSSPTIKLKALSLLNTQTPTDDQLIFSSQQMTLNAPVAGNSSRIQILNNINNTAKIQRTNTQAIGKVSIIFQIINKPLWISQSIRVDLGQIAIDNTGRENDIICQIRSLQVENLTNPSTTNFEYRNIDQATLTSVYIWPKQIIFSQYFALEFTCQNVLMPFSATSPTGLKVSIGNLTQPSYISSADIPYPQLKSKPSSISTPSISKKFTTPGSQIELTIEQLSMTIHNTFYLKFPVYYKDGLGQLSCYNENLQQVYCLVSGREVMVRGVQGSKIIIWGVVQPINYKTGIFHWSFDQDHDPKQLNGYGSITDDTTSDILDIQNFPITQLLQTKQSSNILRNQGTQIQINFYLKSTLDSIGIGQALRLVFSYNYYVFLKHSPLSCSLSTTTNSLKNYISSCKSRGTLITMPIVQNLPLGQTFVLTISSITLPLYASPISASYYIQFTSANENSIVLRSFQSHNNFLRTQLKKHQSKKYLWWYEKDTLDKIDFVQTSENVLSKMIFLSDQNSPYQRSFQISGLSVSTNPSELKFLSGSDPIGVQFTSSSGVYFLKFNKSGDGDYYMAIPPIILLITNAVLPQLTLFPQNHYLPSSPQILLLQLAPPYPQNPTQFNLSFTSQNLGIRFNVTSVVMYSQRPYAKVGIVMDDASKYVISSLSDDINVVGSNYNGTGTFKIYNNGSDGANTGVVNVSTPLTKMVQIEYQCGQNGYFIYHLAKNFDHINQCQTTQENLFKWAFQGLFRQGVWQCGDKLGVKNVVANDKNTLKIDLPASTAYNYQSYCVSYGNNISTAHLQSFQTQTNGGEIKKFTLYFQAELSVQQKIKMCCYLALYFKADYFKVSTHDGYFCSQLISRVLTQYYQEDVQIINNFDLKPNKIQKRILQGQQKVDVYFGINTGLATDNIANQVFTNSSINNLKSSIIQSDSMNAQLQGLPQLINYDVAISPTLGNIQFNSDYLISNGSNFFFLYNLRLNRSGIIYAILGKASQWDRDPTVAEIKTGNGPEGKIPIYFQVMAYNSKQQSSSWMHYSGLQKGTNYSLYLMGSDENPFQSAAFTEIIKVQVSGEIASRGMVLILSMMVIWFL